MIKIIKQTGAMESESIQKNKKWLKSQMSWRNFCKSKLIITAMFLFVTGLASVIFNSCKTNDVHSNKYEKCDDINSGTSLFTTLKLIVTADRVNYNYASVPFRFYDTNLLKYVPVAEAEGKNPTLIFKDVPDEYLTNILEKTDFYDLHNLFCHRTYIESSITISNENAKVAVVETISLSGSENLVTDDGVTDLKEDFVSMDIEFGDIAWGEGIFVYCNTDCDISGELDYNSGIIDIHLKKGWNKVFDINCKSTNSEKIITFGTDDVTFSPKAG